MAEELRQDYLGQHDVETDQADDNSNPVFENYKECDIDSAEFNQLNQVNTFVGQGELFDAMNTLKETLYLNMFQKGLPEQVHDPAVLNRYVNLCGQIFYSILMNEPLTLDQQPQLIKDAIAQFLTVLNSHLQQSNTLMDNKLRTQFIKLHLHCFPYCMRNNCLSMD